jgi:ubiquinone/menaquinone biosynthesis C-methylase UbiE
MVRRWDQWKNPLEREYAKRGRLWRGRASIEPLPEFAPAPRKTLEIGCGDGKFVEALSVAGYDWTGLDFSRHALRLLPTAGRAVLGDARRLPFADARFPLVIARFALGALSMKDRAKAAAEMVRVLARDGVTLVEEFAVEDFRFGKGTPVEHATFERNQGLWTHYFTEPEVRMLFPTLDALRVETIHRPLRILGRAHQRVSIRGVFGKAASTRHVESKLDKGRSA